MSKILYTPEEHRFYGVMCLDCKQIAWYRDKTKCNIHIQKPFKVLDIESPLGPVLGFGAFEHNCGGPITRIRGRY